MVNLVSRLVVFSNRHLPWDRRNQADRLCHFAQVLMEKREFSMALERFEAALELENNSAIAWAGRGQVLSHQQRHREALLCLARAVQLLPIPILLLEQAKILGKLGLFEAVVHCCDEVLKLAPNHGAARIYRAYALCQLGCYEGLLPSWLTAPLLLRSMSASCPLNFRRDTTESVGA